MNDINSVTISGEVDYVFDKRETPNGTTMADFKIKFFSGNTFEQRILVHTYGEKAEALSVNVGDKVLIAGSLRETRWEDKDEKGKWHGRHDLNAFTVNKLSELLGDVEAEDEGNPFDDD